MDKDQRIDEAPYIESPGAERGKSSPAKRVQRAVSSMLVVVVLAAMVVAGMDMVSATSNAYLISVDGRKVAAMVSEREAYDALELAVQAEQDRVGGDRDFTITYGNNVEVQEIPSVGVEYYSTAEVADMLSGLLDFQAEAVALQVDDVTAFYVSSAETAIQAVNAAKAHYGSGDDRGHNERKAGDLLRLSE